MRDDVKLAHCKQIMAFALSHGAKNNLTISEIVDLLRYVAGAIEFAEELRLTDPEFAETLRRTYPKNVIDEMTGKNKAPEN